MKQVGTLAMCLLLLTACRVHDNVSETRDVLASPIKSTAAMKIQHPEKRKKLVKAALQDNKFGDLAKVEGLETDEPFSLKIEYQGKENLSDDMTTKSIQLIVRDAVYAIKDLGLTIDEITVNVTYPFKDKYGNTSRRDVIQSKYSGTTIKRLNANKKNFKQENLPNIAEEWWIHPSFD